MALYAEFCFLPINIIQRAVRERERDIDKDRGTERERERVDNYISKSKKIIFLLT